MSRISKNLLGPLLAVIILFFGFLLLGLNLLVKQNTEHEIDIGNTLWVSAQLDTEYARFLDAFDRYALGDERTDSGDVARRFDILLSRLPLFLHGQTGALFGHVEGAQETVLSLQSMLKRLERGILALAPGDMVAYRALREELGGEQRAVHKMVLDTFLADEAITALVLEGDQTAYWLLLFAFGGIVACGSALVVLLFRQVRRAEKAETEATLERNRAVKASRTKSQFLAHMSHELRTPLNAIVGFTEVMKMELFGPLGDERYKGYLADVHASAVHLVSLVEDILDLSKIAAGKYELREETFDIAGLISASVRLLRHKAESAEIDLSVPESEKLPLLRGDPRVVQQIILNLLSNAIKFTERGGWVSVHAAVDAGGDVGLSISDNGVGIAQEDLRKVLAPFGQVANLLTRGHGGTGLGLPLARSLAKLHGGDLEIASEPKVGTTVTVTFPKDRVTQHPLAA